MEVFAESQQHCWIGIAVHGISRSLYTICAASGEVLRIEAGQDDAAPVVDTSSAPGCLAFDRLHSAWLISIPSDQCVGRVDAAERGDGKVVSESVAPLLSECNGRRFIAPSRVAVSPVDGEIFFTDAGGEGESSLYNPAGAVYRTVNQREQVVALQPSGLAQPNGIAIGSDGCVFVCEMGQNRLVRYVPRGGGAYYAAGVFFQFRGSMGPTAVAVHPATGHIFAALLEWDDVDLAHRGDAAAPQDRGRVVELDAMGNEVDTYFTPGGQLRDIAIDEVEHCLYVVESDATSCRSTIYRLDLAVAEEKE